MTTDIQTRIAPPADARIAYGRDASQFGDLRVPRGPGRHPLAIVLHGGWWRSEVDLGYMSHLAAALAADGIATWNLEFRRLGATGGGWPATFLDVAAGADHVQSLATAHPIDPTHVIAIGHSAGGHLALWLAARRRIPKGNPLNGAPSLLLRGALSIAGAVDLRVAQALGLRDGFENRLVVEDLLGGTPTEVPERYAVASPADLLPLGVPQVLLHGAADEITPFEIPSAYTRRARERGDDITLTKIEGADHFDPIDPDLSAFGYVRDGVRRLID